MAKRAHKSPVAVDDLRREGGRWLKDLRESRGLSQRELARLVGAKYTVAVSQLETGRARIPPEQYKVWAEALGQETTSFVRSLLRFYDPITYDILFGIGRPSGLADETSSRVA